MTKKKGTFVTCGIVLLFGVQAVIPTAWASDDQYRVRAQLGIRFGGGDTPATTHLAFGPSRDQFSASGLDPAHSNGYSVMVPVVKADWSRQSQSWTLLGRTVADSDSALKANSKDAGDKSKSSGIGTAATVVLIVAGVVGGIFLLANAASKKTGERTCTSNDPNCPRVLPSQ